MKNITLLQTFINYICKNFITLGPGVNVLKRYSPSSLTVGANKLECLSVVI
jgi:hypothetical protein